MKINLKKLAHLAAAGVAVLAMSAAGGVDAATQARGAQAIPGTFASSIVVANPGTATANVSMQFVKADGTSALASPITFTVPAGSSVAQYVPGLAGLADGRYSVVLDSDQNITAVASLESLTPELKTAYNGISQTDVGTTFNVPQIFKSYVGIYTTALVVQNAGTATANVTVRYYRNGAQVATESHTIPANASKTIDQASSSLPDNFSGSAVVSADQPLAVIFLTSTTRNELSAGRGARSGATVVNAPALYNYYAGAYRTSLVVQNVDTTATNVTVRYFDKITQAQVGQVQTATIQPGSSASFLQFDPANPTGSGAPVPYGFIGSAVVTSTDGKQIVAIGNMAWDQLNYFESYNGFAAASATARATCPTIMNNYYGWNTFLTIQNVGSSSATVTITYKDGSTTVDTKTITLPANGVDGYYTPATNVPANGRVHSATVQGSTGSQIVAMVNQQKGGGPGQAVLTGDQLSVYSCANS